jgi:hypothetical protein
MWVSQTLLKAQCFNIVIIFRALVHGRNRERMILFREWIRTSCHQMGKPPATK